MRVRLLLSILILAFCQVVIAQDDIDFDNTYTFDNGVQFHYGEGWQVIEMQVDGVTALVRPEAELIFATAPFIVADELVPLTEIMYHAIGIAEAPVPSEDEFIYLDRDYRHPFLYRYDRDANSQGIIGVARLRNGSIGILDIVYFPSASSELLTEISAIFDTFDFSEDELEDVITLSYNEELALNAHWYGLQYYEAGDTQNALDFFNLAIESNPTVAIYYGNRGNLLMDAENYDAAIEDFTRAIEVDSEYELGYFDRGFAYVGLGEYELAIADHTEAIRLNPENPLYYTDRGATKRRLGDFVGAVEDYTLAIELDPENAVAYFIRAQALAFLEDFDSAVADYDRVYELDPDFGTTIHLLQHYVFDEVENAIQLYSNHISREPEFAPLYFHRGNAYRQLGDTDDAIADLNTYLELAGDDADPRAEEWLEELDS